MLPCPFRANVRPTMAKLDPDACYLGQVESNYNKMVLSVPPAPPPLPSDPPPLIPHKNL